VAPGFEDPRRLKRKKKREIAHNSEESARQKGKGTRDKKEN